MQKNVIWVIDDDPLFQHLMKRWIDKLLQGCELLQFENGKLAIEFFRINVETAVSLPQLIFVDINMPFLNGWQFLDEFNTLKKNDYLPAVYMASSSSDRVDIDKASAYKDLKGYLIKPIAPSELSLILNSVYNIS